MKVEVNSKEMLDPQAVCHLTMRFKKSDEGFFDSIIELLYSCVGEEKGENYDNM